MFCIRRRYQVSVCRNISRMVLISAKTVDCGYTFEIPHFCKIEIKENIRNQKDS